MYRVLQTYHCPRLHSRKFRRAPAAHPLAEGGYSRLGLVDMSAYLQHTAAVTQLGTWA